MEDLYKICPMHCGCISGERRASPSVGDITLFSSFDSSIDVFVS